MKGVREEDLVLGAVLVGLSCECSRLGRDSSHERASKGSSEHEGSSDEHDV